METVFLHLLNMSITAGWIALAVIILRLFLKKAPKWITVLLWGLVGLRLIFPFSIESVLSLIPSAETVPPEIIYAQEPQIHTGVEFFNSSVNPVISESLAPQAGASVNPVQIILFVATIIWLAGVAGMLIYTLVSYLRLKSKVKISMPIDKNIYICDSINTPFILGVIKPKIYLPSTLSSTEQEYVLSHEKAHLKRRDHLIKPLGFLLLSVYWFNPLLWVAYVLLCRDIETACDEKVIKDMELQQKKEYSTALLNCSVPRRMIAACPLAFGEVSVKQRIKTVLNYKKPAFWITIVAIILCIALSVGFLTNPVENNPYGVKVVSSGSDIEGVSLELLELEIAEDLEQNPYIEVKWKNKNNESYTCGEEFYVYKYVNGEWVNIRRGDYAFVTIGYMIPAKGSFKHSYDLWNIEIDEVGTYRFESTFLRNKGDTFPTEYKTWIDFEVTKVPDFEENGYKTTNSGSDRDGISAQIVDLNLTAAKPYIEVMWKNDNDHDFTCGEQFYIYKLENGEWINCRSGEYAWEDIGYIVPAKGTFTHKYSLYNINIDTAGTYRFESPFSSKGDKVWMDFQYPYTGASSSQGTNESFEAKDVTHYYCNNTTDVLRPQVTLYRRTRDFKFTLSALSSYAPTGKYSTEGNILTLTADDGNKYVFEVLDAENLKFIADKSADIPKYKYSPNEEAKQPFTDGDIFELEPKESTNIVQGENLYLDFEVPQTCIFTPKELIYSHPLFSYTMSPEEAPEFSLVNGTNLLMLSGSTISEIGYMKPIKLDNEHFYSRIFDFRIFDFEDSPYYSVFFKKIKANNISAMEVELQNNFYQLLKQNDNSYLLVIGFKTDNNDTPTLDNNIPYTVVQSESEYTIRWIYSLTIREYSPENLRDAIEFSHYPLVDISDATVSFRDLCTSFSLNSRNTSHASDFIKLLERSKITPCNKTDKSNYYVSFSIENNSIAQTIQVYDNDVICIFHSYVSSDQGDKYYKSEGIYQKLIEYSQNLKRYTDNMYTIDYKNYIYHCTIKANDGSIIDKTESSRTPNIELVDKNLIFKWEQNGTGTLTRSGKFYNLKTKEVYGPFIGKADYHEGKVCTSGSGEVKITLLSNPDRVQIINNFEKPVSSFVENIKDVYFTSDGNQVAVVHYSGEYQNGEEVTLVTEYFDVEL